MYKLPNGRVLFENLSFEVPPSSGLLIHGPTGSGKSTLTKLLLGVLKPAAGQVEILGNLITGSGPKKITATRRNIGFMMQEPVVFEELNLIKNISLYLAIGRTKCSRKDIITALYQNGFSGLGNRKIKRLSLGQTRMIEIIRIVLKSPRVVVLDQPYAALDHDKIAWLADKLKQLTHAGASVVVTYSRPEVRNLLADWPEIRLQEQPNG